MYARVRAEAAPAVFNVHVRTFIDVIWNALRDNLLEVRLAAVSALRACLVLVEQRETRYRVQWWYRLFEQTMKVLVAPLLSRNERDVEAHVHASLLALGELLEHTREFMLARCAPSLSISVSVAVSMPLSPSLSFSLSVSLSLSLSVSLSISLSCSLCLLSPSLCLSVSLPMCAVQI